MATIETLIVQLFDRKRQIIDQLKQRKLLYDHHLASKLLIQGISPPPCLIASDSPSNLTAVNKAGLISGLLQPRPGPVASCPHGHDFSYDQPILAVNDNVGDEASAGNCLSSNRCDEDVSSLNLVCHNNDDTGDGARIVSPSHVEVSASARSYLPMSLEDQPYTRTGESYPKQEQSLVGINRSRSRQKALELRNSAKTSGKSRLGMSNQGGLSQNKSCQGDEQLNGPCPRKSLECVRSLSLSSEICYKEEALIKVRSPDASGCSPAKFAGNEFKSGDNWKNGKKSSAYLCRDAISSSLCQKYMGVSSARETDVYFAQLDGSRELLKSDEVFALPTESCPEEKEGIRTSCTEKISDACRTSLSRDLALNCNGGSCSAKKTCEGCGQVNIVRGYVKPGKPFSSPTESCSEEERIRTCSIKGSGDALKCSVLRDFTMNNDDGCPSAGSSCHGDEQENGLSESLEFVKPFSVLTEHNCKNETSIKMRSPDPYACLLTHSANNEANEVHIDDNQGTEKRDTVSAGRITRSSGFSQQSVNVSSGSKRHGYSEQLDGLREYLDPSKALELPADVFSWNESRFGTCSIDRSSEACNNDVVVPFGNNLSLVHKQLNDQKDFLETVKPFSSANERYNKEEASSEVSDTCFGSLLQSVNNEAKELYSKDDSKKGKRSSVYEGRITRSSNHCEHIIESCPIRRSSGAGAINISVSKSANIEAKEVQMGSDRKKENNSNVFVGRITRSRSHCQKMIDSPNSKTYEGSELFDGSREFYGSYKSSALPTEIGSWKEAEETHLTKESCEGSDISLTKSVGDTGKDEHIRDGGEDKSSSASADRITTSRSGCRSSSGIPSSSKTSGDRNEFNDIRETVELVKQIASPMGMISKEETEKGNREPEMQHQEDSGSSVMINMICELEQILASNLSNDQQNKTVKPSHCCSDQFDFETDTYNHAPCGAIDSVNLQDTSDSNSAGLLTVKKRALDCGKSLQAEKKLKFSTRSPMDVDECDRSMPVFEMFGPQDFGYEVVYKDIPNLGNIMEQTSLHERSSRSAFLSTPMPHFSSVCKSFESIGRLDDIDMQSSPHEQRGRSPCLSTPVSPFPAACKSHLVPGIYSSVPNKLLDIFGLRSTLWPSSNSLQRKSHSDLFSFPQNQCFLDIKKPFLSPVGRGVESITSKSGGSEVRSGNPELTCFTIMEDPESSEEDINEAKTCLEVTDSSSKSSGIREPLCDIMVKKKASLVPDHPILKRSSECSSRETNISEICNVDNRVNATGNRRSRRTTQGKENNSLSVGGNTFKKHSKAPSSRFSKPKVSGHPSARNRGQRMSEKDPKCNNIVCNVKSFVPLVQQKTAALASPVKRDVKVKALEAAEAAKRLAEKRENERKQKKEALKTERARLEQENVKQMELAKRLKEEAKRKREAENASKKRQREEDEKKEKERKRKRVDEARCQQKKAEEKIHAWREKERTLEGNELNKNAQKESDRTIEASILSELENELVEEGTARTEAGDGIPTLDEHKFSEFYDIGKVDNIATAESSTPNFNKSVQQISQTKEASYDISPYQCSDDEEEEDDEIPNKKHIPSWASKSSVLLAVSSLQHLDVDTTFPPGSFCSLDEVLVPRRLPQDSRKS